jgi:hypothetical protein
MFSVVLNNFGKNDSYYIQDAFKNSANVDAVELGVNQWIDYTHLAPQYSYVSGGNAILNIHLEPPSALPDGYETTADQNWVHWITVATNNPQPVIAA